MTSLEIYPSDNAAVPASGDDDRLARVKPTRRIEDFALKLASLFLKMLDATRGQWEFRTFDDEILPDGSKRQDFNLTCAISGSLKEAFNRLAELNGLGAGVFVTINRTDGKGRKAANVIGVQALFADTDGADIEPLLALKPHIAVESSPGKYHLYWRVGDCDPSQFKALQKAIAEKYGTDPAVCDLPRVMRLPGFFHNKLEQHLVMIVPEYMDANRELYLVQEVVEGLGLQIRSSRDKTNGGVGPLGQSADNGHEASALCLTHADPAPPPIETMLAMLKHLAAKNYFEHRQGVITDADGRIIKIGWIDGGMALKPAYAEAGFDLWAETHLDEQARNDAPTRWASFAAEARPGDVTIATVIKAAKDAGFVFPSTKVPAAPVGYVSHEPFTMEPDQGLTKKIVIGRGGNKQVKEAWICAPFEILGHCRDPHGRTWGKQIRFRDADNRVHMLHVSDAKLQGDPAMFCAALADEGLRINRSKQRELNEYLTGVTVGARVTVVPRTGWSEVGGELVFVLPTETIGATGGETVVLDAVAHGRYEARGSLEDWQQGVGALTAGHALPVFTVSTALAGPLAHLIGAEGGGIHIFGDSSIGKSAMLQAAASVWGRGGTPGYVLSWRATANGLEGHAASATDTCLVLDELAVGEARDVAAAIYQLANGLGKARAARDGSSRDPKSWRVFVASSGELPLETKLSEDHGRKTRAGQLVRILDIPADRGLGFGAFDGAGGFGNPGQLADAIKNAACAAYGTAGPEFVRKLMAFGVDKVRTNANELITEFVREAVPKGGSEQIMRAAKKFALIALAGDWATKLEVAPWAKGEAKRAAICAFNSWVAKRGGTGSHEERQAIEQVRLMIEKHGNSRFEPAGGSGSEVRDRLGWRKGEGSEREWYVPAEIWKAEFCQGLDPTFAARTLAKHGMLRRQDPKHLQCVVQLGGNQPIRAYVLTEAILDRGNAVP